MQQWPWCSFGRLREVLTAPSIGCQCELIAAAGAVIDLEGNPTPALYAFTRVDDGDLRFAPVHADGDDRFIPGHELRSICAALNLDIALFERPN